MNFYKRSSSISEFLKDRSVLITGATGFLGKALVEKILQSCPEVDKIYMLVRPKHGHEVSARFREYVKKPIFNNSKTRDSNVGHVVCDVMVSSMVKSSWCMDKSYHNSTVMDLTGDENNS